MGLAFAKRVRLTSAPLMAYSNRNQIGGKFQRLMCPLIAELESFHCRSDTANRRSDHTRFWRRGGQHVDRQKDGEGGSILLCASSHLRICGRRIAQGLLSSLDSKPRHECPLQGVSARRAAEEDSTRCAKRVLNVVSLTLFAVSSKHQRLCLHEEHPAALGEANNPPNEISSASPSA